MSTFPPPIPPPPISVPPVPPSNDDSNFAGPLRYDRLAIASLVCGLLAYSFPVTRLLFATPPVFFTSPVAFVLGILALRRIKTQPERLRGHGIALAGMILGAIPIVALVTFFFLWPDMS